MKRNKVYNLKKERLFGEVMQVGKKVSGGNKLFGEIWSAIFTKNEIFYLINFFFFSSFFFFFIISSLIILLLPHFLLH